LLYIVVMAEQDPRPLHVRVAEALGCHPVELKYGPEGQWDCGCTGYPHAAHTIHDDCHDYEGLGCEERELAHYDLDWAATGPLIEKYEIMLVPAWRLDGKANFWDAVAGVLPEGRGMEGDTPLLAVCHLLLALKEAGKL
jgi:hypothetical protein